MAIDLRPEAREALEGLLDKLTYLALTLGVISTGVGLFRVTSQGWHLNVITDLLFFLPMVGVLLARKRLPIGVVVSVLVGLATLSAVASFMTLGLGTMSFVILTVCCAILGVVFGMRSGFVYLVLSVAGVGAIGTAVCTGVLRNLQATDPFLLEPQTWFTQIAGFAAYTSAMLVVVGTLQTRLSTSLAAVSTQARELRASEERYRLLADSMQDVLFLQDMNFKAQFVSPSVERLFGYSVEEFLTLDLREIFTPESRERVREDYLHHVAMAENGEVEVPPKVYEYLRKDGSTFWGEVIPTFVRNENGLLVGVQGLLRDISDRKQVEVEREVLERELRQAEKLKAIGQLAGGIAHDFNNQLASIMAHADLLTRGVSNEVAVADHARKILSPARNAADLTSKLLAFARKGTYEHRPVDMHEVINEVAEILARGIDRRIQVKRHYEAEAAVVDGDRTQLQNVLLNLGLNARDAMPDGGEIVFRTGRPATDGNSEGSSSELVIEVSDDGVGMDDWVLERAFEPFFTTKALGKGTGMGLSAAYGTIASHDGRILIDSRVGEGTRVRVALPLSQAPAEVKLDTMAERIAGGSARVMVIDDEDSVRLALTDLLESLGCTVVGFDRASKGADFFHDRWREIDLVVLDLVLPDMNGREVLAIMREINPDVPVLLVSGYTADDGILELQRSDTIEFLEKPFLLADLAECLTRLTGPR